ncbi:TPA: hypothetical protein ACIVGF_002867 [Salmonella enterica subsp. enterica serovar 16:l,v:-]|nr:hypothetical protein [Salmonella enterica]
MSVERDSALPVTPHSLQIEALSTLAKVESDLQSYEMQKKWDLQQQDPEEDYYQASFAAEQVHRLAGEGCIATPAAYEIAQNIEVLACKTAKYAWEEKFPDGLPSLESLSAGANTIREDLASKREQARLDQEKPFTVLVTGRMTCPEDDPLYGTYTRAETIKLTKADSITDAANAVAVAVAKNEWNIRDPERDYFDPDFGRDMGPIEFSPNTVEILDKQNVRVLSGHFQSGLTWEKPATDKEAEEIRQNATVIRQQARQEGGWDNHETSRQLWAQADRLETRITGEEYRNNAEVTDILQQQENLQQKKDPEQAYSELIGQVKAVKEGQAERLETVLRDEIASHQAFIDILETHRPGLLAAASKKDEWVQSLEKQKKLVGKKQVRLDRVESLHKGMGLNGPRLDEMAVAKARHLHPDIAEARDKKLQEQRGKNATTRNSHLSERKSHTFTR